MADEDARSGKLVTRAKIVKLGTAGEGFVLEEGTMCGANSTGYDMAQFLVRSRSTGV